jgi:hypothetical protein
MGVAYERDREAVDSLGMSVVQLTERLSIRAADGAQQGFIGLQSASPLASLRLECATSFHE